MSETPLLEVRDLRIRFGAKEVVHGIHFTLRAGEKLALVGESGSGKTVTALSLLRLVADAQVTGSAGLLRRKPASGLDDLLSISEQSIRGIRGDEVAMVFQEPMTAFNPLLSVGQQIAEVLTLKKGLPPDRAWEQAVAGLERVGLPDPARRARSYPHQLSGGQRQRAMIAMALACEPRLLLADEPTTALDVTLRGQILDLLGQLQQELGMAVLLITHDLQLVRRFADRVAVMEHGHLVEQGAVVDVFAHPVHPYTRRLLSSRSGRLADHAPLAAREAPMALEAENVSVSYPVPLPGWRGWWRRGQFDAVRGVSFTLPRGQTLGVVGESGSGKSTLAQAVLGLLSFQGDVQILGERWPQRGNRGYARHKALRQKLQVVFQDPFSSLSPRLTVEEIVAEGLLVHEPGLPCDERRQRVLQVLRDVGLDTAGILARYPHEFSGGQRQRLAIARALIISPTLLVLDEPTSALDVTVQHQVLSLLAVLQRRLGLSYLLITHDMAVIQAMAHEVIVMQAGQVVEAGPVDEVLERPSSPYARTLMRAALDH